MNRLTKDTRGFIDSLVTLIESDGKSQSAGTKVKTMLGKVVRESVSADHARVVSAVELTTSEKSLIENLIYKKLKTNLIYEYAVDPDLIGGFRITVGDWIIDTSITTQLELMRKQLTIGKI
ncbi:hypothetical protein A2154_02025 [Candidatus Gottesmanbacteria bacterium RBG_16_43_7]|uniref:Uncharacterized protein n=1 Tax=Candidatus Gottesmanbacteria bacterium RBG_16_43_7 TaxID=1798373 RepID=A0A1F5Z9F9_9BACT|nr:MAG: hypothetical protein A2154_02025 [Candidatus Gottesmanbacteria bacterium RBG_16_43_7]